MADSNSLIIWFNVLIRLALPNFRYLFAMPRLQPLCPLYHRDPFERMLVAQGQAEGLTLVTDDSQIAHYNVPLMAAR